LSFRQTQLPRASIHDLDSGLVGQKNEIELEALAPTRSKN
jgi:hypothetical protein